MIPGHFYLLPAARPVTDHSRIPFDRQAWWVGAGRWQTGSGLVGVGAGWPGGRRQVRGSGPGTGLRNRQQLLGSTIRAGL